MPLPPSQPDAADDTNNPHGVEGWLLHFTAQCAYNTMPAFTTLGDQQVVRRFAIRQHYGDSESNEPRRPGETAAAYTSRLTDPKDMLCLCSQPSAAFVNETAFQRGWKNWTTAYEQRFFESVDGKYIGVPRGLPGWLDATFLPAHAGSQLPPHEHWDAAALAADYSRCGPFAKLRLAAAGLASAAPPNWLCWHIFAGTMLLLLLPSVLSRGRMTGWQGTRLLVGLCLAVLATTSVLGQRSPTWHAPGMNWQAQLLLLAIGLQWASDWKLSVQRASCVSCLWVVEQSWRLLLGGGFALCWLCGVYELAGYSEAVPQFHPQIAHEARAHPLIGLFFGGGGVLLLHQGRCTSVEYAINFLGYSVKLSVVESVVMIFVGIVYGSIELVATADGKDGELSVNDSHGYSNCLISMSLNTFAGHLSFMTMHVITAAAWAVFGLLGLMLLPGDPSVASQRGVALALALVYHGFMMQIHQQPTALGKLIHRTHGGLAIAAGLSRGLGFAMGGQSDSGRTGLMLCGALLVLCGWSFLCAQTGLTSFWTVALGGNPNTYTLLVLASGIAILEAILASFLAQGDRADRHTLELDNDEIKLAELS
eukprot:SAG31_NODE_251_length_19069_cov_5.843226_13_plen_592_part_00